MGFKARLAQVVMLPNIAFDLPLGMVQLERQESGWFQRTFQVRRWRNHLTRGRRRALRRDYARTSLIKFPCTSVSRISRPVVAVG